MDQAILIRESRSQHLLRSSEDAAKQLRAFKQVLPITSKNSPSSVSSPKPEDSSSKKRRES
ncbi:hypothetical protein NT6N_05970 [Oceaniferula spumae]|uniref:Uncharacterized protein n=1 Tax=Oceaniferula spumae TaxID=2979115 RepID=A0AAT9FHU7_9BACT